MIFSLNLLEHGRKRTDLAFMLMFGFRSKRVSNELGQLTSLRVSKLISLELEAEQCANA